MERPTSPPPPPRLAGQYELQELLGEGALGQVYRARHQTTGRPAAVKFLKDVFGPDPIEVRRRFAREIKILARLDHPNIIRLFDADTSVEPPYLVCELVDGKNLDEFISRKSLDMAGRLALCVELAQAVAYLHHNNLIHRDIKPANVLMTAGGSAKLGDFGLARGQVSHAETRLTKSGVLVGTMLFMAPELFSSGSPSQGSDQFSLALVLALILSWNTTEHLIKLRYGPLSGESPERQLLDGVPGIPTRVKSALARALLPWPKDRWPHVDHLIKELQVGSEAAPPPEVTARIEVAPRPAPAPRPGTKRIGLLLLIAFIGLAGVSFLFRDRGTWIGHHDHTGKRGHDHKEFLATGDVETHPIHGTSLGDIRPWIGHSTSKVSHPGTTKVQRFAWTDATPGRVIRFTVHPAYIVGVSTYSAQVVDGQATLVTGQTKTFYATYYEVRNESWIIEIRPTSSAFVLELGNQQASGVNYLYFDAFRIE